MKSYAIQELYHLFYSLYNLVINWLLFCVVYTRILHLTNVTLPHSKSTSSELFASISALSQRPTFISKNLQICYV